MYVKITNAKEGFKIKCGNEECDWWTFISRMNAKIATETIARNTIPVRKRAKMTTSMKNGQRPKRNATSIGMSF